MNDHPHSAALERGMRWLYETEQPDRPLITHHGVLVEAEPDRILHFRPARLGRPPGRGARSSGPTPGVAARRGGGASVVAGRREAVQRRVSRSSPRGGVLQLRLVWPWAGSDREPLGSCF